MEAFRRYRERYGENEGKPGEFLFACAFWVMFISLESYGKCVLVAIAIVLTPLLHPNREVHLARQEVMDSICTSIKQSTMNVGTKIGTDTMQSITNLGTDLGAYMRQLPMRYWPIAQENHAIHAMHAMRANAE